ncbi:MAG TPA: carbamoyltransferase HypF [Rhizomicrobium sp.]|nr:carbamoyltransferase HypF [Rhizomicrobium sp.]
MEPRPNPETISRLIVLGGQVQGVGFRPFVWRLAHSLGLKGAIHNSSGQVKIAVAGPMDAVARFERALFEDHPPLAKPRLIEARDWRAFDFADFRILDSRADEAADVHLPPDLFCCDDCVRELQTPGERRFRYPFTNCTQCGPRYTIIKALPYDRPGTSMAAFAMCPACRAEYENPGDRRFHAQPLACPDCGPQLTFRHDGATSSGEAALRSAVGLLRAGGIVAAKGVGGYHLLCDAADDAAVWRLRARKHRPHKPLAVMFPQTGVDGLDAVHTAVTLSEAEAAAVRDPARPIVLARRRQDCGLSAGIAPGLDALGVFLPYSPLHHLLLGEFGAPLVATSGNVSGEPVITGNDEAERRLGGVADAFLHHDRPIVRPADDSVVRAIAGAPRPVRIGRGMAPREIDTAGEFAVPTLAVGGHMKSAVALGWGKRIVVSPHIGELDSPRSLAVFEQVIEDLSALYRVDVQRIVCDAHPGYASTRWAVARGLPVTKVLHHRAHASAVAGEHPDIARWLVFTWDGVGYGEGGELWGGEAFAGSPGAWKRVASFRPFHLLGEAGREPWRSACALMWESGRDFMSSVAGAELAHAAWHKRLNTARTSAVGRLFDAAAALVLGVETASFEGQGPMMLEAVAEDVTDGAALPLSRDGGVLRADWQPLPAMLTDGSMPASRRAGLFHDILARTLVAQAEALAGSFDAVGLSGGVFQNRRLAERVVALFSARGIRAFLPEGMPANDGGIAFGQLIEAMHAG